MCSAIKYMDDIGHIGYKKLCHFDEGEILKRLTCKLSRIFLIIMTKNNLKSFTRSNI